MRTRDDGNNTLAVHRQSFGILEFRLTLRGDVPKQLRGLLAELQFKGLFDVTLSAQPAPDGQPAAVGFSATACPGSWSASVDGVMQLRETWQVNELVQGVRPGLRPRLEGMTEAEYQGLLRKDEAFERAEAAARRRYHVGATASSDGGGAQIDDAIDDLQGQVDDLTTEVNALTSEVNDLKTQVSDLEDRVAALEDGEVDPPSPPEPPDPGDKTYPDEDDEMCGVPEGTKLTDSGSITVTKANTVIENKNITGTVIFNAPGGILRNCRITSGGYYIVQSRQGADFEMHHCELNGNGSGQSGFDGTGHIHHCRISKCENPFNIAGDGALIEWNDVHEMTAPSSGHKDGIQADGSITGLTIRNNRLDNKTGETSAVMLDNYWGPIRNVEVTDNFLGGGSFPAYLDGSFNGSSAATGIAYRRNVMRKGGWGAYFYTDSVGTQYTREDNVDYQTGENVDNK